MIILGDLSGIQPTCSTLPTQAARRHDDFAPGPSSCSSCPRRPRCTCSRCPTGGRSKNTCSLPARASSSCAGPPMPAAAQPGKLTKYTAIVEESRSLVCQFSSVKHCMLLGRRPSVLPAHQGNALVVLHKLGTPAGLSRW